MPSPFPGVDPFLEDQFFWPEFHSKFINWTQDTLAALVPDAYEVRIEGRLSLMYEPDSELKRHLQPDIAVTRSAAAATEPRSADATD